MQKHYTIAEFARAAGVGEGHVRNMVGAKKLVPKRVAGRTLLPDEGVNRAYLAERIELMKMQGEQIGPPQMQGIPA